MIGTFDCGIKFTIFILTVPVLGYVSQSGASETVTETVSPVSRVWGPGLNPQLVLPVRYFYIYAVGENGQDFNVSAGENAFVFNVEGLQSPCRIFKELLDRKDGSYIARYRLYDSCHGLKISLTLRSGLHVAESPYIFYQQILHSDCKCPISLNDWKHLAMCPARLPQIIRDLEQFRQNSPVNITKYFSDLSMRYHPQSASFCLYSIRNQQLYRKCSGEHVGFNTFMDQIFLFLLRRTSLPDFDVIVNLGDYPLSSRLPNRIFRAPVFSWCGSNESYDILMPTYDVTESSLHAMNRVSLDLLSVQATKTPLWDDKIPKGFWRGRDAREERLKLVEISRKHPELVDAALTNFFFFRDHEATHGPKVPYVDFFQFFQYKYQLNLDGTVAAYRFPYLLAGDSVVFKQESVFYEHFYKDLEPWKHYIPIKRDLSDLIEKISWAKNNDDEAKVIAKRGASYVRSNLMPNDIFCYYTLLFENWAKLIFPVEKVTEDFIYVSQPTEPSDCDCSAGEVRVLEPRDEL